MKKILFGITSLTLGGAERVLVDMVNKLCDDYEITIFTIYGNGNLEKDVDKRVKIKNMFNFSYKEMSNIQKKIIPLKILLLQKYYYNKFIKENYDIEIAFLEGPITRLLSTKNLETKKIAWVHNDISKVYGEDIKAKIKLAVDKNIYNKYEKLIFVSNDNKNSFDIRYKNIKPTKEVIYNYINAETIKRKAEEEINFSFAKEQINFLTVARLVKQKGIDRLVKIHKELILNGYKNKFYIIGDGPERKKLEEMIEKENVTKTFLLLGAKENPYPYIKKADIFALLSKFEGYGMVLEEAKILNKPIIITDTAAREAVRDYKNSVIVENDEHKIYEKLKFIIENNIKQFAEDKKEYNNEHIINTIKKLFNDKG